MIPFIGWLIAGIMLIPYWLTGRARDNEAALILQRSVDNSNRPWAWMVTRTGPTPWGAVWVPPEWFSALGLRSPTPLGNGQYLVEQIERSREAAIAAATQAVNTLTNGLQDRP
jgi:hypothetical protein